MRSMLFVPATDPAIIAKAAASPADGVCIDLEDSVPVASKVAVRANVSAALRELDFGHCKRIYRINALDTGFAYRDVVEVVEAAGDRVQLIMIPKVSSPDEVRFVDQLVTQIELSKGLESGRIRIEAQIETAAGFVWMREIANVSPRLDAIIFGAGDYSASMHMPSSSIGGFDANDELYPGHRWHAAMHAIVANARARGVRCMDGPYAAFRDTAGFERACRIARTMGFDGKQCIHPSQIATVHAVFGHTPEAIAHAKRVVEACDRAAAAGKGVALLDGAMIDEASARMARVVLADIGEHS